MNEKKPRRCTATIETAIDVETTIARAALETTTNVEATEATTTTNETVKSTAAATAKKQKRGGQARDPMREVLQLNRATRQRKKKRRPSK
jgi:hypothetical protein